jgi:hypothetical protein
MKHRTIVPHIINAQVQFGPRDIGDQPANAARCGSQTLLANVDRDLGNIESSDVLVAERQEIVG